MPRQLPIQDGRQFYLLHQGQQHHKVIDALRCYLKLFFHALQYARKFRVCLAHYANGELLHAYASIFNFLQLYESYQRAFPNWEKEGKLLLDEASSLVKEISS